MTSLTLHLMVRTWRWVPGLVLYLAVGLLVFDPPGPALHTAATMFLPHLVIAVWFGVIAGNVDDDGHRDMMSAMAGSPSRLHRHRAAAAAVASSPLVALTGLAAMAGTTAKSPAVTALAVVFTEVTAVGLGTAMATWLHRPILRHAGVTALAAIGALVVFGASPPVADLLRSLNAETTDRVWVATAIAIGLAVGSVLSASSVAHRRNG